MNQPLPDGEFAWEPAENYNVQTTLLIPEDGSHGYIFEVDFECPERLHDRHDYYLVVEKKKKKKQRFNMINYLIFQN